MTMAGELVEQTFDSVLLRGDSDFSLTWKFDNWTKRNWKFVFGYKGHKSLIQRVSDLRESDWRELKRRDKSNRVGPARAQRRNTKDDIIVERGYTKVELHKEHITEFAYRPGKCDRAYRMIAVRKTLKVSKGVQRCLDQERYFFYISNYDALTPEEIVWHANDRCDQENLIEQLKNGIKALHGPVHDLNSNWAYMVIASLAWSFKAWFGLLRPRKADRVAVVRMDFRTFLNNVIHIPAQVYRQSRQTVVRLLAFTDYARLFFSRGSPPPHPSSL